MTLSCTSYSNVLGWTPIFPVELNTNVREINSYLKHFHLKFLGTFRNSYQFNTFTNKINTCTEILFRRILNQVERNKFENYLIKKYQLWVRCIISTKNYAQEALWEWSYEIVGIGMGLNGALWAWINLYRRFRGSKLYSDGYSIMDVGHHKHEIIWVWKGPQDLQVSTVGMSAMNMRNSMEKNKQPVLLWTLFPSLPTPIYNNPINTATKTTEMKRRCVNILSRKIEIRARLLKTANWNMKRAIDN